MKPSLLSQTIEVQGHTFLATALKRSSTVIDLGANTGEFSRDILQHFQCRCIAVEPNPSLLEKVRVLSGIEIAWAAVSDCDGQIDLRLSDNPEASTILSGSLEANGHKIRVPARTLESLLKEFGVRHVDLMKVDIEGSEVSVILSAPNCVLQAVDQISIEFHDFCKLVTAEEIAAVYARLKDLDFDAIEFGSGNENTLFVRRGTGKINKMRRAYVRHVTLRVRNATYLGQRMWQRMRRTLRDAVYATQEQRS